MPAIQESPGCVIQKETFSLRYCWPRSRVGSLGVRVGNLVESPWEDGRGRAMDSVPVCAGARTGSWGKSAPKIHVGAITGFGLVTQRLGPGISGPNCVIFLGHQAG